jgi:hypothetical protein
MIKILNVENLTGSFKELWASGEGKGGKWKEGVGEGREKNV